jgi:gliding motility-associated-like protein
MKRILLFILISFFLSVPVFANHITGGEMFYTLVSQNGNDYTYRVTLKLYRDCFSTGAQLDASAPIAVYNKSTGVMVWSSSIPRTQMTTLSLGSPDPCINNPPAVCYEVGYYTFEVTLPGSVGGYTVAYQRCCRIAGINNLIGSSSVGATYTAEIPGTLFLATAPANNSAKFVGTDTVIVCANNAFLYSFAATDDDGDALSYSFCDAFTGGTSSAPAPNPPSGPPYSWVPYSGGGFSGSAPLGSAISINTSTGLLSGIAPAAGIYVVTVCVAEIRNGVTIATQRKDLQIKVGDCDRATATLNPEYVSCDVTGDPFTLTFSNNTPSALINSYNWDFGDLASGVNNTSSLATPSHTFSDTGVYTIKLVTNRNQPCSDSATAIVKVFPGFFPGFTTAGICYLNPVQFIDTTRTVYGTVNSWSWNFGDLTTVADTSHQQHPIWQYPGPGPKTINFIVTSSKGCVDTVTTVLDLLDKPPLSVAFKDTLICITDNVQLQAIGTGNFSWTPLVNIINPNTATPTVSPTVTTTYTVELESSGCRNRDTVRVRVVDRVTLSARADTTSCQGDPVQLNLITDGLQYIWSPAATLNNPTIINPIATPTVTTTYQVIARIGSCTATDDLTVFVVPYPFVTLAPDTTICYNTPAQLYGTFRGTSFIWTPSNSLNNPNIINPIATPPRTTNYILSVFDTLGCPKPGRDSMLVTVLPKIRPFAGRDTAVIIGQPLQFNAEGGVSYLWTPSTGLSNPTIANPVGIYDGSFDNIRYRVDVFNAAGCSDSAFVNVKIFKTAPSIFVPTAFTPNNDGLNDVIRPIAVGMKEIKYFRIYNRWGQMVFSTTTNGQGWDGRINGSPQATNVFVWMVSATDYLGNPYFRKGTVTLIR